MTRKSAAILFVLSVGVLALVLVPAQGFAAKGGNGAGGGNGGGGKPGGGGSSSLTLVVLDPDDGGVNHGEQVTFEVSTTATDQPHVNVSCSQGGTLVYSSSAGFYDSYPWPSAQVFTLSSRAWSGGAADCKAALSYWDGRRFRELASLSFPVYA